MGTTGRMEKLNGFVVLRDVLALDEGSLSRHTAGSLSIYLTTSTFRVSSMPGATMRMK